MSVLIVDDIITHSRCIEMILKKRKFLITVHANDAFEAFATLKAVDNIQLMILDQNMPFVQGTKLIEKLRQSSRWSKLPVVISTSDEEEQIFLAAGANAVLHKPISVESLLKVVDQYAPSKLSSAQEG